MRWSRINPCLVHSHQLTGLRADGRDHAGAAMQRLALFHVRMVNNEVQIIR